MIGQLRPAHEIIAEALSRMGRQSEPFQAYEEMQCRSCGKKFEFAQALNKTYQGTELQCCHCENPIVLTKIGDWKVGRQSEEVGLAQVRQKMFEDLAKRVPFPPKDPDWATLLFEDPPPDEEVEPVNMEWEDTEGYWKMIEGLKGK
jgi:hypothetical protein